MDGEWEAPMVDNPEYKGLWKPRKIDNPHFFVDDAPHAIYWPHSGAAADAGATRRASAPRASKRVPLRSACVPMLALPRQTRPRRC